MQTKGSIILSDIDLLHCFFLHLLIITNADSPITWLQQTFTAVWNPHTHYADDRKRERKKTKPKTCSEQLQLKFFRHANIEPNELWQYISPLAAGVSNQLWETSHHEHMSELTEVLKQRLQSICLSSFGEFHWVMVENTDKVIMNIPQKNRSSEKCKTLGNGVF